MNNYLKKMRGNGQSPPGVSFTEVCLVLDRQLSWHSGRRPTPLQTP